MRNHVCGGGGGVGGGGVVVVFIQVLALCPGWWQSSPHFAGGSSVGGLVMEMERSR